MPKNGMPRQMLARHTEEMASFGSPRKLMFCLIRPRCLNNQEKGLNTGSKIMNQPRVESAVGTIQGIITAARTGLLNRMLLFRTSASPRPSAALNGHRHQGVDERVPRGLVEDGVGQQVHEVPEADEVAHPRPITLSVSDSQIPRKNG